MRSLRKAVENTRKSIKFGHNTFSVMGLSLYSHVVGNKNLRNSSNKAFKYKVLSCRNGVYILLYYVGFKPVTEAAVN